MTVGGGFEKCSGETRWMGVYFGGKTDVFQGEILKSRIFMGKST